MSDLPLYKHQYDFLQRNPDIAIISWEAGLGKTRAAIEWLKLRPGMFALIVVPKAIKEKWADDMRKWECTNPYMIVTKEEVKKGGYSGDVLIVDEAHHVSSPLFIAKDRSQVTEAVYEIIKRKPDMPRLFLTANPVRSTPANMHTLLYMTVRQIPWKDYQAYFYRLMTLPYLPRPAWMPKPKWQKEMTTLIDRYCSVALMRDCFDVPAHEYQTIYIPLSNETKKAMDAVEAEEWEPIKVWYAQHRLENGKEKLEWIKEFAEGRKKIVIVCRYKEQIAAYAKALKNIRETFVLTGDTKDQGQMIKDAQESPECFLIVQSQVTAGYDLDQFSTMIFASCDWSWVNHSQAHGRINRAHNLHRNEYIYLVAGEKDKAIFSSMEEKKDFDINSVVRQHGRITKKA